MRGQLPKVVLGMAVASVALWGADPFLGTWKLNLEKSNYGTVPAPKSGTTTCAAEKGGAFKCTQQGVDAQGQATHTEYTARYDGKDYPMTGMATIDTVSFKRIDPRTIEATGKKAGQVFGTVRTVLSKDGRTRNATWRSKDEAGKPISWTTVADKQ